MTDPIRNDFTLQPDDGERLSNLVGPLNEHLRQIELRLGVEIANHQLPITNRGSLVGVLCDERSVQDTGIRQIQSPAIDF